MPLPPYNSANSGPLDGSPPFAFPGVTMRTFPLKADMYVLRTFCSQYVNIAPPEVAEFVPFVPFVYLSVIHYGQMAAAASNLGWVSQHEVAFSIPLMQYRRRNGRREFVGFISLTPFIFVDDVMSLTMGRQVYGWPKVFAKFSGGVEQWLDNPIAPQTLLSLRTDVLAATGAHTSMQALFDIDNVQVRDVPFGSLSLRPWIRAATTLPRAALAALSLGGDLMEVWAAPPFLGYAPYGRALLAQALLQGFREGLPLRRNAFWDILTLKQFRDAEDPERACFQALIRSRMTAGRFNGGGLMGGAAYLQGDPSGGYRIKVFDYASNPIVSSLGLEVEKHVEVGGRSYDMLRPVYPFWIDLDLLYGHGQPICWRTERSWHARGRVFPPAPSTQTTALLFNTAQGLSNPEVPGPFEMNDGIVHVLVLGARYDPLLDFVRNYLAMPADLGCFELAFPAVFLAVGTYGMVTSKSQPMGSLSCRTAGFFVPVVWNRPDGPPRFALVPLFLFTDNPVVSITSQEASGFPVAQAKLTGSPNSWLRFPSPQHLNLLLRIDLQLFPVLNLGAQAEQRALVGIASGPLPVQAVSNPGFTPWDDRWFKKVKKLARKHVEACGCGSEIVRFVTLKQFRAAPNPSRACFQQYLLSKNRVKITSLSAGRKDLNVWIYRYASLPIVETLGLIAHRQGPGVPFGISQGAGYDILEPLVHFSYEGSVAGLSTRSICWRAASERWHRGHPDSPPFAGQPLGKKVPPPMAKGRRE